MIFIITQSDWIFTYTHAEDTTLYLKVKLTMNLINSIFGYLKTSSHQLLKSQILLFVTQFIKQIQIAQICAI